MRALVATLAAASLLAAPALAAPPKAKPKKGPLAQVGKRLQRAAASGLLDPAQAARDQGLLARAKAELGRLPTGRADELRGVFADLAANRGTYSAPRSFVLFSTLEANLQLLRTRALPPPQTDALGPDGVLYRFFPGHGWVFHPLGNFSLLNQELAAGNTEAAASLAQALVAHAIPDGGVLRWEYEFPFASGVPPWTSGMAQAVAAQALSRASTALGDPTLLDAARRAYAAIPDRLVRTLPAGPWIELYSFDRAAVLNAQLQAALSLGDYASAAGDSGAQALADGLTATARTLLPRFDTGWWSRYSLGGADSPLGYHEYVISLLNKLANRTGDDSFRDVALRFRDYESEAPALHPAAPPPDLFPAPQDGYRDEARFGFWLSKLSTVTLRVGKTRVVETLGHGYHVLSWRPGPIAAGTYHPVVSARGPKGLSTEVRLAPIRILDELPPQLTAEVTGRARVAFSAVDPGTPWLSLRVRLARGPKRQVVDLGRHGRSGTVRLELPRGRWHATLVAVNTAGLSAAAPLGVVPRA